MVDFKFYICSKWNDFKFSCCENFNYYYRCYIKTYIDTIYFNYIYPIEYRHNCIKYDYI